MKIFLLLIVAIVSLNAMNVSEIASFSNQRDNFLYGKGVVIGLEGTGDRTKFTNIILNNILNNSNVKMDIKDVRSKNIASVMITAKIPPFLKKGDMFNVEVSGIGDSKSLMGGSLYFTFLEGSNGKKYATCQGSLIVSKNNLNTGTIIKGCILEREIHNKIINRRDNTLSLHYADLSTMYKIKKAINKKFGFRTAIAIDTKNLKLNKPEEYDNIDFMYEVLQINLNGNTLPKIVIDKINKIIISGNDIEIEEAYIVTDKISIKIGEKLRNNKNNLEIDNLNIDLNGIISTNHKTTIGDLVFSLQSLKVPFEQIVDIIFSLKEKKSFKNEIILNK